MNNNLNIIAFNNIYDRIYIFKFNVEIIFVIGLYTINYKNIIVLRQLVYNIPAKKTFATYYENVHLDIPNANLSFIKYLKI